MRKKHVPKSVEEQWEGIRLQFKYAGRSVWDKHENVLHREWFSKIVVDCTVWFFFQGTGTLTDHQNGQLHAIQAGSCLCMAPGVDLELQPGGRKLLGDNYIHFDLVKNGKTLSPKQWPTIPFITEVVDISLFFHITRQVVTLLNPSPPGPVSADNLYQAECLMKGLLLNLTRLQENRSTEEKVGIDRHHERAVSATLSALYEDPRRYLSVGDLAKATGYSPAYFRHLCLKITGEKPNDLLIKARMERAKNYLRHSELTVGQIADALGYENIYYFSRQFRQVTGATATAYRQSFVNG